MKMRSAFDLALLAAVFWCAGGAVAGDVRNPWVIISFPTNVAAGVTRVTYGNGVFLAAGGNGTWMSPTGGVTATSADGYHWTVHNVTGNAIFGSTTGLAAGKGEFAAVGDVGTNGVVQLSPDGVAWSAPVVLPMVPSGIAYANGTYVVVGQSGALGAAASSSDGLHWSTRTFAGCDLLSSVAAGGGTFVAVGDSGAILTSANGSDWLFQAVPLAQPTPAGSNIYAVVYGKGMFAANASLAMDVLTSTDGTNWVITPLVKPWTNSAPDVRLPAYGNGLFVGIGNGISISTDGIDWRPTIQGGAILEFGNVAYGAGTFVFLVGDGGLGHVNPNASLAWGGWTDGRPNLTLTGGWPGQSCRLQAATDLAAGDWVDLFAFTNLGSITPLRDPSATNYAQRYYRVAMP